jgi:monofunctional biosynthetic peptidoglycan transglycosylase
VFSLRWIDPSTTSFILRDRTAAWWEGDQNYHYEHEWVDFAHIATSVKVAVMASEDQKFPEHHGFDFDSMQKAWDQNQRGRKVKGASTITQQVAKNLFLWPGRSLFRKGVEAWFTVLLETFCSKQRILELYLNSAEFGKGVFGVETASQRFFRKPAARLNPSEAALLAAVLPAPKRFLVNKPSSYLRGRQAWIESQMLQVDTNGLFDP